jgi:hypothetical protein
MTDYKEIPLCLYNQMQNVGYPKYQENYKAILNNNVFIFDKPLEYNKLFKLNKDSKNKNSVFRETDRYIVRTDLDIIFGKALQDSMYLFPNKKETPFLIYKNYVDECHCTSINSKTGTKHIIWKALLFNGVNTEFNIPHFQHFLDNDIDFSYFPIMFSNQLSKTWSNSKNTDLNFLEKRSIKYYQAYFNWLSLGNI